MNKSYVIDLLYLYVARVVAVAVAFTLHEYVKGKASVMLGDRRPVLENRLTLNPIKNIEPIGFILAVIYGYGWSRETKVNTGSYEDSKKGTLMVFSLPIFANLVLGIFLALIFRIFSENMLNDAGYSVFSYYLLLFLREAATFSISFAVINLLPIAPFCGFYLLRNYVKPSISMDLAKNSKIYLIVLIFLTLFGITGMIISPVVSLLSGFIL